MPAPTSARPGGVPVERGHRRDRLRRRPRRCALCRLLSTPDAERLGQRQRQPGPAGVVARSAGPGRPAPVTARPYFGLGVVDAVPAGQVAAGLAGPRPGRRAAPPAASSSGSTSRGQQSRFSATSGRAAHGVHVGERVGRGDPAPVVRVVDDRGEEVGGGDERRSARRAGPPRRRRRASRPTSSSAVPAGRAEAGDHRLQLARRDLAGAATAARVLGQPDRFGHPPMISD